jgi:TetR/AcrR family transcriptional regulator, mexJK operon transcriptional repressor
MTTTESQAHAPAPVPAPGSVPRYPAKRAAIAGAALKLFVRDGYERTSVDAIAAEAGVSKRTVYSHYADKERLFLAVVEDTYDSLMEQVTTMADVQFGQAPDLRQGLLGFIGTVAHTMHSSPERNALVRLILTESPHFPALTDRWRRRRLLTPVLVDGLRSAVADGTLDAPDLDQAAAHLSALTFGQINNRSLFGLIELSGEAIDDIITGGVDVFLRAYLRR